MQQSSLGANKINREKYKFRVRNKNNWMKSNGKYKLLVNKFKLNNCFNR